MNGPGEGNPAHGPSIIYRYISPNPRQARSPNCQPKPALSDMAIFCPAAQSFSERPSRSYPGSWPVKICRSHPSRNESIQHWKREG